MESTTPRAQSTESPNASSISSTSQTSQTPNPTIIAAAIMGGLGLVSIVASLIVFYKRRRRDKRRAERFNLYSPLGNALPTPFVLPPPDFGPTSLGGSALGHGSSITHASVAYQSIDPFNNHESAPNVSTYNLSSTNPWRHGTPARNPPSIQTQVSPAQPSSTSYPSPQNSPLVVQEEGNSARRIAPFTRVDNPSSRYIPSSPAVH